MKALVGAFNQEKALVEAFSVIVKTDCETDGSSAALYRMRNIVGSVCGHEDDVHLLRGRGGGLEGGGGGGDGC